MDFPAQEDEPIGVEHLLEEPKYHDLVDCVRDFDTFYLQQCLNTDKLSGVGYGQCINTDADTLQSRLVQVERTKNDFLDRKFEETNCGLLLEGTNDLPETCEDYLLDTEFDDSATDFNCIPTEGSCVDKSGSDYHNGANVIELFTTSSQVTETDEKPSSLLDEMTIDELHKAFKTVFGRETAVTDKLWLKHRISFGLKNLDSSDSLMDSTETEWKTGFFSTKSTGPLTGVFNFKTKPRGRFARRERRAYSDSFRTLSFEDNKNIVVGSQDFGEKSRRSRKPTQRYVDQSIEQTSRIQRRKCGIPHTFSKEPKESRQSQFGRGKELFEGAIIQVPFGNPVEKGSLRKKVDESKDVKEKGLRGSYVESHDIDLDIAESADDVSEDDCITKNVTHNNGKSRRKHHTLWSLPEVLKLVEGVSEYGVGRWTEIKKLMFPSHAHRTSVDLKDKWRNLLRASCMRSQSKRGVEHKRKHGSHAIPQHILRRVRELAEIYPYPRDRKIKVSRNVAIATPVSASTCDNLLPFSTAVRV